MKHIDITPEEIQDWKDGKLTDEDYEKIQARQWSEEDNEFYNWMNEKVYYYVSPLDAKNGAPSQTVDAPYEANHIYLSTKYKGGKFYTESFQHYFNKLTGSAISLANSQKASCNLHCNFIKFGDTRNSTEVFSQKILNTSDTARSLKNIAQSFVNTRNLSPEKSFAIVWSNLLSSSTGVPSSPLMYLIKQIRDYETGGSILTSVHLELLMQHTNPNSGYVADKIKIPIITDRVVRVFGKKPNWAMDIDIENHINFIEPEGEKPNAKAKRSTKKDS